MNLSKLQARISNWKKQDTREKPLEFHIAHLHSEVSEVFEALRELYPHMDEMKKQGVNPFRQVWFTTKGGGPCDHPEGFGIELADVILVALFIADVTGVNIEDAIETKMVYNETKRAAK
jgi:NTP pyrophosphatase (non-canonical NTP hydrolase)